MGPDDWVVDFPTLGFLCADWVEAHCIVPDGFSLGQPFVMDGWQLWCVVNHYRVRRGVSFDPERPLQATAFHFRRSQVVGPQKTGKGPWSAAVTTFEAVGPCLFAGWAAGGEVFRCEDDDCGCGFEYVYEPGEPMGMRRPTSLIQLLATSEDQVDNVYRPLQGMIRRGPLAERMLVREGFIRLPEDGRIDPVTAAANSKLGNPINFAVMDESGLYTARNKLLKVSQTMRRGLAGMGGRSIETTNPWDPMEASQAQQTFESRQSDIFRFYRKPPADLSYKNKRDRHKIHQYVYEGSPWVDLAAIEAEAAELLETDPTQAERFFGNRLVQGLGSYMPEKLWEGSKDPDRVVQPGGAHRARLRRLAVG
ncbi:terminase [Cellulomonas denverensis]|uniref:terminase n=1 Tax=Cellulomonas denverensis TaxID=264297 RepID=UPI0035EEDE8C